MNPETLANLDKLDEVGQEPSVGREHTNNKEKLKEKRKQVWCRYRNWLIGLVISLIPLFAVPFIRMFKGENDFGNMLYETFSSYEIIFVGISLAIAALNDFIAQESKGSKEGWTWLNIIIIAFGAMIYGGLAVESNAGGSFDLSVLFKFNLAYLGIIFMLGTAKYYREFREVR